MKKTLLVTIIDVVNLGTFLQALASVRLLEKVGLNVTLLYYIRKKSTCFRIGWNKYAHYPILFRFILTVLIGGYTFVLRGRFIHLLKRAGVKLTSKAVGIEGAAKIGQGYDIYIVGSDQVWNSVHNSGIEKTFLLDFVSPESKANKYAFSSSIGVEHLSSKEIESYHVLADFKAISVREMSAQQELVNIGIREVQWTLDPTLVYRGDEWYDFLRDNSFERRLHEPYLLIYSVEGCLSLLDYYAETIANRLKLKKYLVTVSAPLKNNRLYDRVFSFATPSQFISLMHHATFVIVSSFHGTAFSINMNKNFITIAPNRFSSRIDSLLELVELHERKIVDSSVCIDDLLKEINYDRVNRILERERKKTKIFISNIK